MIRDRSDIFAAKDRLPLPELMRALGVNVPQTGKGNVQSPFHLDRRQKTPSFSIFARGGRWFWCDRTGGQEIKGDEITFLEKYKSLSRAAAIELYLKMASVEKTDRTEIVRPPLPHSAVKPLDWATAVEKFS